MIQKDSNNNDIDPLPDDISSENIQVQIKDTDIDYEFGEDRIYIKVNNISRILSYPEGVLSTLSENHMKACIENFIYCKSASLRLLTDKVNFNFPKPSMFKLINNSFIKDIPRISCSFSVSTNNLEKKFSSSRSVFKPKCSDNTLDFNIDSNDDRAILSMSFGKDSLISYGLLNELGFDLTLVTFNSENLKDNESKSKIINSFERNTNKKLVTIFDESDLIPGEEVLKKYPESIDYTNGLLAYSFALLPLSIKFKSKYIVFGNEKDLDSFNLLETGEKLYHSYDQCSNFMRTANKWFSRSTNKTINLLSVIKPIYDISIYKILSNRYPQLLEYLLSCEEGTHEDNLGGWCFDCYTCAKTYLYLAAFNDIEQLKGLGFRKDMFEYSNKSKYSLFWDSPDSAYKRTIPSCTRDEQLLAFLLVFKNGYRGDLIDLFEKNYLKEALNREKELRKRFFKYYLDSSIPENIRGSLKDIFKEELDCLVK